MNESGFNKFYWGFFFIMINFRIQGVDIFPDIVGYLFLASGFSCLASRSDYFGTAAKFNIPMIILSIFSIYQAPAQSGGINLGLIGLWGIPILIASFALNLYVVYNLFMGISDMANKSEQYHLALESDERWKQFKILQIAPLFAFILIFIPLLALVYVFVLFVVAIVIALGILDFIKRCRGTLSSEI